MNNSSKDYLTLSKQGDIHLWVVNVRDFITVSLDPEILETWEQRIFNRLINHIHKRNFLIRHASLRVVLARYSAVSARDINILVSHEGKPYIKTPLTIPFSISHRGDWSIIAVGTIGDEIGCDIELYERAEGIEFWRESRIFSSEEFERILLKAGDAAFSSEPFINGWSLKEAASKALGRGLLIDPLTIDVSGCVGSAKRRSVIVDKSSEKDLWGLWMPFYNFGVISVASRWPIDKVYLFDFDSGKQSIVIDSSDW